MFPGILSVFKTKKADQELNPDRLWNLEVAGPGGLSPGNTPAGVKRAPPDAPEGQFAAITQLQPDSPPVYAQLCALYIDKPPSEGPVRTYLARTIWPNFLTVREGSCAEMR